MIEIPPQRDAAVAWAALPEPVRRDALHNVENGGAPDDPAVAAIVVGVLRVHRPMRSWSHRILSELPYAAIIGGLIALQYMGMLSLERGLTYAGGTVFAIALAVAAIEGSRRFLVFWALVAMAAAGIVAVLQALRPETGDYHRLLHHTQAEVAAAAAVITSWVTWGRHVRLLPLRITETGLRFGWFRPIAWPDVLGSNCSAVARRP